MRCARSHLYPGCRIVGGSGAVRAAAVELAFPDGPTVVAELLDRGSGDEALALAVPAHRTAAGTAIPDRVWAVDVLPVQAAGWDLVVRRRVT